MSSTTPDSGGTATSFTNTPQAKDDSYKYLEDLLRANSTLYNSSTNTILLDVMSNDLGGNAKSLFSVYEGDGDLIDDDFELLAKDVNSAGVSCWELTQQNNWVRINNGKIEYRIADGSGIPGQGRSVDSLTAGQCFTDEFVYAIRLGNGTLSEAIVKINITGSNDQASIAGTATGSIVEDGSPNTVSATLAVSDVDFGEAELQPVAAGTSGDNGYGTFEVLANGQWTYTLNNSDPDVQALTAGQIVTDSITVWSEDLSTSTEIEVTITGTNDVPVLGGVASGDVTEDVAVTAGDLTAEGLLTIVDDDAGESSFAPQAATAGSNGYGTFTLAADGSWTYAAANGQAAIQQLGAGDTITDSFTAVSSDGSASQLVTVTITGTNDVPVLGGVASGDVTEDVAVTAGDLTAEGLLTIVDDDAGESSFAPQAATAGSNGYGTFTLAADGSWTYAAANGQAAIQQLGAGDTITDSFTAVSSDGSASQLVTVTITGTNDVPVLGGVASGDVTEDVAVTAGDLTAEGLLTIVDDDAGESSFAPQAATAGSNGYGTFTLAADGSWTYAAANGQAAIQQLGAGDTITDSFTAVSSDGSASQLVTVTITGTNDVPVLGGVASGDVTEDVAVTAGDLTAEGLLTIVDDDAGESSFAPQAATAGSNGYGTFTLAADGSWTYAAANGQAAIQQLGAGDTITDSFTAVSSDGSASQLVTVTITGTNDVAVITAVAGGDYSATEAGGVANVIIGDPGASGQVSIADVDAGEAMFQSPATLAGTYGTFTFSPADGQWTYTLDNSLAATQALNLGPAVTETLTVTSLDGGTTHNIVVNVSGANDAAVIGGDDEGEVTEAGAASAGDPDDSGTLTAADVDNTPNAFQPAAGNSTYGSFTINAAGQWNYSLNNAHPALATLAAGFFLLDSFIVYSDDGTAHTVEVRVNGADDVIVVTPPPTFNGAADPNDFDLLVGGAPTSGSFNGGGGNDILTGDGGNQNIDGNNGNDTIYGGGGNDSVTGNNGDDNLYGQAGIDTINGNNGLDAIYGGSGGDNITGGGDADTIYGGSGNDTINGSGGDDVIIGGYGSDTLTGGTGSDTFKYLSVLDTNDFILDFLSGTDFIDLSALDANGSTALNDAFGWGGSTPTANSLWYAQDGANTVVYADTDGNVATAEFMITLQNYDSLLNPLQAVDFGP